MQFRNIELLKVYMQSQYMNATGLLNIANILNFLQDV